MRRGSLSIELAEKFTTDPSLAVRAIAFQSLAAQGGLSDCEKVRKALSDPDEQSHPKRAVFLSLSGLMGTRPSPDIDSIIVTCYRTKSTEELLADVNWFSVDSHLAYRALALDRFDRVSADLRSDLANGFGRIKEESSQRLEREIGPERCKRILTSFEPYDEFIRSRFTQAALIGLAKNTLPQDAALARPYLTRTDSSLRDPAVTVVSKVGNSEDAAALLKIAKEAYGDVTAEAAAGALKLSSDPLAVARELILTDRPEVAKVALAWIYTQESRDAQTILEELLCGENSVNRIRALYCLSKRLQSVELVTLLKEYIGQETYYYNVVTWLDRLLYSPPTLREMFVRDLEQKAR